MLQRVLENEVVEDRDEAIEYDSMDHQVVNRNFVADLIAAGPLGEDLLDLGTGTALIPIELCRQDSQVRIMASDFSGEMLELARYRLEVEGFMERVQLHHGDAKKLIFQAKYFDTVMSNSLVHHLPSHETFLPEVLRVLRPNGLLFIRDLCRPNSMDELESLVALHAATESPFGQQMFRQSLHAALTLDEIAGLAIDAGLTAECVSMTSDRHWTLVARKIEIPN
ncbi:MAG: class I SAM-dependent methyltransferase [Pirellula sp.]